MNRRSFRLPCAEYTRSFFYHLNAAIESESENYLEGDLTAAEALEALISCGFSRYINLLTVDLSDGNTLLNNPTARRINYDMYEEVILGETLRYVRTVYDSFWFSVDGSGKGSIDMARHALMELITVIVGYLHSYLGGEGIVLKTHSWKLLNDGTIGVSLNGD